MSQYHELALERCFCDFTGYKLFYREKEKERQSFHEFSIQSAITVQKFGFYHLKHLNYNRTYSTFHLFSLKYFPSPDWFNKRHPVCSKRSPSNHNENVKGQGQRRNTSRVETKPFCI